MLSFEALDRTTCKARSGRGFGPVVRQTTKCMNQFYPTKTKTTVNTRYMSLRKVFNMVKE